MARALTHRQAERLAKEVRAEVQRSPSSTHTFTTPPDGYPYDLLGTTATDSASNGPNSSAPVLAFYTGGPLDTFSTSIVTAINFGATGDIAGSTTQSPGVADGTVHVTYTYLPAPAAMGVLSLGGLVALRRRR